VNLGGPDSPPVAPGPKDVFIVGKDFPDFRILRFESYEMINNVPNRSGYRKEKANQSDGVDASEGV
jgi:peroxiredoxin